MSFFFTKDNHFRAFKLYTLPNLNTNMLNLLKYNHQQINIEIIVKN